MKQTCIHMTWHQNKDGSIRGVDTSWKYTSSIFGHALLQIVQNLYCNISMMLWSPSSGKKSTEMTPGISLYGVQRSKVGKTVGTWISSWCITTTATMTQVEKFGGGNSAECPARKALRKCWDINCIHSSIVAILACQYYLGTCKMNISTYSRICKSQNGGGGLKLPRSSFIKKYYID